MYMATVSSYIYIKTVNPVAKQNCRKIRQMNLKFYSNIIRITKGPWLGLI